MQTITISKKAALWIGLGFIFTLALATTGSVAWASHQFRDVDDEHVFHDAIAYVADARIANGFPDGTYRPSDTVTRGQMAAFFHRASGNSETVDPSVNAAAMGGKTAEQWQSESDAQQAEIDALTAKLQFVSIVDSNTMRIAGANLQIVSGSGSTEGGVNGLGNLIVGYNENSADTRTGSHNLVVGPYHSYSSYAGAVVGADNNVSAQFASVTGGQFNTASGAHASVTGGVRNMATGPYASVTGGHLNIASGNSSSVTGGDSNAAGGIVNSVTGGYDNTASGQYASVTGGRENTASGQFASVTGGWVNTASNTFASVTGGQHNTASGATSSVSGGASRSVSGQADWRAGTLFEEF